MSRLAFYFDSTRCVGCKTCVVACNKKNRLPLGVSYRHVTSYEVGEYPKATFYHWSRACNHCENPARVREVPDDFIGIELDFLAKLADRARSRYAAEDPDWQRDIRDSRAFLENHLIMWIDLLAESIEGGYGNCFYARLTRLASLIAKRDLALSQEIL